MFNKISLLVPLRGNPGRRNRLWESIRETSPEIELVVRLDDDDEETLKWVQGLDPLPTIVIGPRLKGYASLPRFFNEMAARSSGDIVMCGNDDMIFSTLRWDLRYLQRANDYPDGVFDIGSMTYPAGAFPFSVISKKVIQSLGFLNDERLLYSDIFLRDLMGRFGRLPFIPDVGIKHEDPDNGEDVEALNAKYALHINAGDYWKLHNQCVNEAVEKVRPLLSQNR